MQENNAHRKGMHCIQGKGEQTMNKNMFDVWFAGLQDAVLLESLKIPVNNGFSRELIGKKEAK